MINHTAPGITLTQYHISVKDKLNIVCTLMHRNKVVRIIACYQHFITALTLILTPCSEQMVQRTTVQTTDDRKMNAYSAN